ncbi:MAG: DUF3313 domain-containing protein [Myxococcota bacterium]
MSLLAAAALLFSACATTQQVGVSNQNYCPFLGAELCSKLSNTGTSGRFSAGPLVDMRYLNPSAQWAKYDKILLDPVTYWSGDDTKVSPEDQQRMVDFFTQALNQQLATKYAIVREPGPGVMTLQVALIDVDSATPVLRTISMLIPQARALATLKYIATGTYAFIGGAEAEAKIMDSQTHQVLGAAVDKRVGGGAVSTAAQWQWGDAENVMTAWSKQLATRLSDFKAGKM